ncbi:hypothetical protein DACRYDRAFT_116857 [Dacryopinax primogenitus]|uniref:Uncharacterized protein n=1 Tax=Dacryopinax primogenitus (strain DJM 731) TaxID=1858805 RepID=M5FX60_DACPD|nr:uncharacterized protein DACRYDRAFT_116857 [Dacryopinax primogenitus]EJU01019.1 hypothetical protein DACRYDRAFT_116857 [Dacryopinax primogenitus]
MPSFLSVSSPYQMTSTSITLPFNLTLGEESATWMYTPLRDSDVAQGWNSSYTESTVWSQGTGIGQPFRRTQLDEAGFWLEWEGTALYLCLSALGGAGYSFSVDGHAVYNLGLGSDAACSGFSHDPNHGPQTLLIADGLPYGTHTAEFNATIPHNQGSLEFYGGIVTLGATASSGQSISSTPVVIDDTDPRWSYSPPADWVSTASPQDINGSHTSTCVYHPGTSASLTFNGSSVVQVIGIEAPNTFGFTVQLTNHNNGLYNATNNWWTEGQTMYFADNLDPSSSYTITITNFNPNLPNGVPDIQNCFNLDAIKLSQPISSGSSPNGGSQPNGSIGSQGGVSNGSSGLSRGAIVGIVVAVVGGMIGLILLVVFFLWRRGQQSSSGDFREIALSEAGSRPPTPQIQEIRNVVQTPGPEPTPFVIPPLPTRPLSGGPPPAASTRWKNEKSARRMTHTSSSSDTHLLEGSSSGLPTSPSPSEATTVTAEMLQNAATVDLVSILNSRLSRAAPEVGEEPPMYGEHAP